MKILLSALLALGASVVPASAITVNSPANGAHVTSPFQVIASTQTCGGAPAVSMGYSIDHGSAVIEPTSFTATVAATTGAHVLHIKCWGKKTNDEMLVNIDVMAAGTTSNSPSTTTHEIAVSTPANNATVPATFSLIATSSSCGSKPTAAMGFSIDNGSTTIEPTSFTATVNAAPGQHVLHVKCWGQGTSGQTPLNINVAPSAPSGPPTAADIVVASPANGATVGTSFNLVASSNTCGAAGTVSAGYSMDYGSTTIEPPSFSAVVNTTAGQHVLHVKCWGQGTNSQTMVKLNVAATASSTPSGSSTQDIIVASPANGAGVGSPFTVAASSSSCGSAATTAMGYSIDNGKAVIEPKSFTASVTAPAGAHVLHVKCWGKGTNNQTLLNINVGSSSGTGGSPAFASMPQFSLPAGQYSTAQTVSLYDATSGSTIYYTTDGSAPTLSSPRYSGPIAITASTLLQAMATAPGYANSELARASYVVVQPVYSGSSGPNIPSNALKIGMIQTMPGWRTKHDPATGGSATGVMSMTSDPTLSGQTAKFDTSYTRYSGVLYSVTYGKDSQATNFVYDAHVWIASGSQIGNLEMDNNQVIANGDTVIYAFQCAGSSNTWDYSANVGTRTNPQVKWIQSNQPCDPQNWTKDTWHHVQIWTSRDSVGNVTYHSVWLDGVEVPINKTVMSAFSLHWAASDMIANFQVDGGKSGGSSTLYLDNFSLYRW